MKKSARVSEILVSPSLPCLMVAMCLLVALGRGGSRGGPPSWALPFGKNRDLFFKITLY